VRREDDDMVPKVDGGVVVCGFSLRMVSCCRWAEECARGFEVWYEFFGYFRLELSEGKERTLRGGRENTLYTLCVDTNYS
jgi:hypothetical protein